MIRTIITILAASAFAYSQPKPEWVDRLPAPGKGANYHYRMASGEGSTVEAARNAAFNEGVNQSMHALGVYKTVTRDSVTGGTGVTQHTMTSDFPIDVVCEHSRKLPEKMSFVRVYLLLRVGEDALAKLKYVPFDCKESKEMER